MSAASARSWPAPEASSISARAPRSWSSSALSVPAGSNGHRGRTPAAAAGRRAAQVRARGRARTFSGAYAAARGRRVLYITERCVFVLTAEGLELVEVAPGIELERDILAQMDFTPVVRGTPRLMDERIFLPETDGAARSAAQHSRWNGASPTTPRTTCSSSTLSG